MTARARVALLAILACACSDLPRQIPEEALAIETVRPRLLDGRHLGPPVVAGDSGPKRFVGALYDAFRPAAATELVVAIDRHYRAPGNDGYEAALERVAERLRAAGFGSEPGLGLEFLESPLMDRPARGGERAACRAWTPLSGRVAIATNGGPERVLHEFTSSEGRDRTMLPVHAPSCDLSGPIAMSLEDLDAGEVLVTSAPPTTALMGRVIERGALALVSANIEPYNEDPSGKFRHLDAVQYRRLGFGQTLPVAMISPRSLRAIQAAIDADPRTTLHLQASVKYDERPLRTLCATIVGTDRAHQAVALVSHVQEPGACDNASGVAGLCESAIGLVTAMKRGAIARPSRSLVFLWGDEFRQSTVWLERTPLQPVAGFSSDMTGESKEKTGALALLERMPDPGAIETFEPDVHTPWGKAHVERERLKPNGLALIARCAMLDVAEHAGGWDTADHPYEGGSDHDEFIARGLPAVLFWHFTDFAYHTSLDRLEHVDAAEMRRTAVALLSSALAMADPKPADLERYLLSLDQERNVRVEAALAGGRDDVAQMWREWTDGARQWLRVECLRIPESELKAK